MTRPNRILSTDDKAVAVAVAEAEPPSIVAVESDFVVILAALLCGFICALGLIAVARCAWLRRGSADSGSRTSVQPSANRGIKKKVIEVLPKFTYKSDKDGEGCGTLSSSDCAICLAEYAGGDEIRVLPQCGHGFHVGCIDTWLSSHSSCPSCRQLLVTPRCKTCAEFSAISTGNVPSVAEEKGGQHSSSSSSSGYLL